MKTAFIVIIVIQAAFAIGASIYSVITTKKMKEAMIQKMNDEGKAAMWNFQRHGKKKKK